MAENSDGAERTEDPTPKRRKSAREKGQVARSQEVNSLVILTTGAMLILGFHNYVILAIEKLFIRSFNTSPASIEAGNITMLAAETLYSYVPIVAPFFIGIILAGLFANLSQVGFHFSSTALAPKFERINPLEGFKKIFSWKTVFEALKNIIKIGVIALVAYKVLKPSVGEIIALSGSTQPDLVGVYLKVGLGVVIRALLVMIIVAGFDYAFQRWQHEKSIKMTLKELRDELKETEGDPLVKERIRGIQREMARRRMMEDVKTADVVVTNPTSLAVAMKYSPGLNAPKVVAKGQKILADRIKKIAREFKVPVIENKPLARALYKSCKVGGLVPVHLYKAVAEILAYVYSLRNRKR
ncbi:MAG: flagellar biosynthesis protein FlhB [Candidatus Krumholzibacteriota bacterium]|nr:flagellar biosynthesis protein FlhB [Candidatus Krumholzibacteriota bacterium]